VVVGSQPSSSSAYIPIPMPICRRLDRQEVWRAFTFAPLKAGSSRDARMAITAITTSSSIKVNARDGPDGGPPQLGCFITSLLRNFPGKKPDAHVSNRKRSFPWLEWIEFSGAVQRREHGALKPSIQNGDLTGGAGLSEANGRRPARQQPVRSRGKEEGRGARDAIGGDVHRHHHHRSRSSRVDQAVRQGGGQTLVFRVVGVAVERLVGAMFNGKECREQN